MAFISLAPKLSLSLSNEALLSGFHGGGASRGSASVARFTFRVNRRRSLMALKASNLHLGMDCSASGGIQTTDDYFFFHDTLCHGHHIAPDVLSMVMMEKGCIMSMADDKTKKLLTASISRPGLDAEENNENSREREIITKLQEDEVKHYVHRREGDLGNKIVLNESAIMEFDNEEFVYRNDYSEVLRWWKQLEFSKQPQYFRDQPMKWFMWSVSCLPEPHFSKQRVEMSKVITLIYVIDDIFDVLGSYEELVHFTQIIERWDNTEILDSVPNYMKICCNTLYDTTNQIADLIMEEHGWNPIDSLKQSWIALLRAFLVEARWFREGPAPKAQEYLENGIVSTGVHVVFTHLYFFLSCNSKGGIEAVDFPIDGIPPLSYQTALILRLWDDLGSAKDENQDGFDGSYVDYYMKEHVVPIQIAIKHTKIKIYDAWKKLHLELLSSGQLSSAMKNAVLNMARMIKVIDSYKDQRLPILQEYFTKKIL